jgi:hypothetical protein
MEGLLSTIVLLSPFGLAIIACVAFGFALAAREALGRERGLREATEQAYPAEPPPTRPVRRASVPVPPPSVAYPDLAARTQRGGLPAPPTPLLRSPVASRLDFIATPARRAATLTDFPVQREHDGDAAGPNDWTEVERSQLNVTLPGVGGE